MQQFVRLFDNCIPLQAYMCYHTATAKEEQLKTFLGNGYTITGYQHLAHANGFAHPLLPAATNQAPMLIQPLRWGFIPSWVANPATAKDMAAQTLNAKCETIFTLPSFKDSIIKQRCLVFVAGFFEWQHVGKNKIPYYIHDIKGQPLALGGIWSMYTPPDAALPVATCSIITTPANKLMETIHNTKKRMPLILAHKQWEQWLTDDTNTATLQQLMLPFDDEVLVADRLR